MTTHLSVVMYDYYVVIHDYVVIHECSSHSKLSVVMYEYSSHVWMCSQNTFIFFIFYLAVQVYYCIQNPHDTQVR